MVQMAAYPVNIVKSPLDAFSQGHEILLDHLIYRPHVKLGIFEKIQQELQVTVAWAAAYAVYRGIQKVHVIDNGLLGICKSQLLVIMAVETELFVRSVFSI